MACSENAVRSVFIDVDQLEFVMSSFQSSEFELIANVYGKEEEEKKKKKKLMTMEEEKYFYGALQPLLHLTIRVCAYRRLLYP
jgi:hypothetical protein